MSEQLSPVDYYDFPEALRNSVVAIEGNIGAGKSVLGGKLKSQYPSSVEYAQEDVNRKFLELFYKNPQKQGFAFQIRMLMVRKNQMNLAKMHHAYPSRDQLFYWDRSMLGDHMFAAWNHLLGGISAEEMRAYEEDAGGSLACMREMPYPKEINLFVLLNSQPVECKRRVEQQRCNKEESGIPLSYYEGIDDLHFYSFIQLIEQKLARVAILHWGEYDHAKETLARLEAALTDDATQPRIERLDHAPPANFANRPDTLIYRTVQDVMDAYAGLATLEPSKHVYIPENILTVDATVKKVTVAADFPITFYQNSYKQVVLHHLSHGSRVVFYKV
jgi:deoxyadenosine/deoxycytidine kinase